MLGAEKAHRPHARRREAIDHVDQLCVTLAGWQSTLTRRPRHRSSLSAQRTSRPEATAMTAGFLRLCGHPFHLCVLQRRVADKTNRLVRRLRVRELCDLHRLEPDLRALGHDLEAHALALPLLAQSGSARLSLAMKDCTLSPTVGWPMAFSAFMYSLKSLG